MGSLLVAWAALAAGGPDTQDSGLLFLRYLARHQMKDGSWGGRPAGCGCPHPPDPPPAPADPEKTGALIRQLGDDDPERRDAAERDLRALAGVALPALKAAQDHADPEVSGRCERLRFDIARLGRGAGDLETTGLVLLSFLGAGYSHFSKDTYDEICYGTVVRNGLRWIADHRDTKDAVANAVAALALSEAYGMTGSNLWKEAAQRGVAAVERHEVKEPRELAWKGLVVASARLSELEGPHAEQAARIVEALKETPTLFAKSARAYVRMALMKEKEDGVATAVAETSPKDLDPETRYLAAAALFSHEGPQGARWKAWNPALKEGIVPRQFTRRDRCERGSWEGEDLPARLRATALSGLALEVYYRYNSVFGTLK